MVGPETTPELHRFSAAAATFAAHRLGRLQGAEQNGHGR